MKKSIVVPISVRKLARYDSAEEVCKTLREWVSTYRNQTDAEATACLFKSLNRWMRLAGGKQGYADPKKWPKHLQSNAK